MADANIEVHPESSVKPTTPAPPSTTPHPPNPKMPTKQKPARTLVLCFDGTANQYDGDVRPYAISITLVVDPNDPGTEHECCRVIQPLGQG